MRPAAASGVGRTTNNDNAFKIAGGILFEQAARRTYRGRALVMVGVGYTGKEQRAPAGGSGDAGIAPHSFLRHMFRHAYSAGGIPLLLTAATDALPALWRGGDAGRLYTILAPIQNGEWAGSAVPSLPLQRGPSLPKGI